MASKKGNKEAKKQQHKQETEPIVVMMEPTNELKVASIRVPSERCVQVPFKTYSGKRWKMTVEKRQMETKDQTRKIVMIEKLPVSEDRRWLAHISKDNTMYKEFKTISVSHPKISAFIRIHLLMFSSGKGILYFHFKGQGIGHWSISSKEGDQLSKVELKEFISVLQEGKYIVMSLKIKRDKELMTLHLNVSDIIGGG